MIMYIFEGQLPELQKIRCSIPLGSDANIFLQRFPQSFNSVSSHICYVLLRPFKIQYCNTLTHLCVTE